MTTQTTWSDDTIAARVQTEVDRAIQRNIKGLEYLSSPDPSMGTTPKDVIYERRTLKLYHYRPLADEVYRVPVVLVMSLVSKPYILDLTPGQSLVEFLLKRGFDLYMIDWGVPRPEDRGLRIDDYVLDFIPDCLTRVLEDSGEPDVSIAAYCMGGTLSVMYAALHTNGPLKNLACFTTPVNYEGMGLFRKWADKRYFDVDRLVDTLGNVPPELIQASFEMLRPATKLAGQFRLWDRMWNDSFVKSYRMFDRWASDQIPFAGEVFRQMTKELMWENKLYRNELRLGGRRVDLSRITVPVLHVMAEHDHIAPYEAARDLVKLVGSADKRDVVLRGGHVSLVAGPSAVERMWPLLDGWLAERSV
jgi:poly[(R)-3-hydroxyalkanoate] polymerase subunit PhaC